MTTLRKNIRHLYLLFLLVSSLMFVVVLWQRADSLYEGYDERQRNLVVLLNNAMQSLLSSHEMLLGVLGQQLLALDGDMSGPQATELLDSMLSIDNSIVAFGLADPQGNLIAVSSNISRNPAAVPNLLLQDASRESFLYALGREGMVLGRTYFMPALGEWVIPVRKRLTNAAGDVVAVMTAGLRMNDDSPFFNKAIHNGSHHDVMLLRDHDLFLQYLSSDSVDLDIAYSFASLPDAIARTVASSGFTMEEARLQREPLSYRNLLNRRGLRMRGHALYNERYELWVLSEINEKFLLLEWLKIAAAYLPILIAVQLIALLLFRFIIKAEMRRQQELMFQVTHDNLTNLPNRNFLTEKIQQWTRQNRQFALLFVDMDNFKGVNDGFGHECGDQVLRDIAGRLQQVVSTQDVVIRIGGDEFVVLTSLVGRPFLFSLAERITGIVDDDFVVEQFRFRLGVSVGIACYPEHGSDLNSLMRAADIAMYEAKKHKNSIRLFEPQMQQSYLRRILIEQKLRGALPGNELYMVYQPKVTASGKLLGVEALIRWENADLGVVPPDQFIPVAETTGMMGSIGQFILATSLSEMQQIQHDLGCEFSVAVNVSVKQFFQENFLQDLLFIVEQSGLKKEQIWLEITENLFIEDMNVVVEILHRLHKEGIRLSMDDFGTGYSSLSVLRQLPVDEIKIDKSFVDNILYEADAQKMIQSIIAIGHNHGMALIAEGVENARQAELLRSYGCDRFQGYHFSRPLRPEELRQYIRSLN